jgi:ERCC4-type nuclease
MKATIQPEQITAICDSREQCPLDLSPLQVEVGTLATGDYSIRGLEHVVTVERKSLSDLISCVGTNRERFNREVHRLLAYPSRLLVVEAWPDEIDRGDWRAAVSPSAVRGSILGWEAEGLPFHFAGSHRGAEEVTRQFLMIVTKRRWREARSLVADVMEGVSI